MKFAAWVHAGVRKAVLNRGVSTHPARINFCSILFSNAKGILLLFLSSFFSSLFISFFFFFCCKSSFFGRPRGLSKCDRFLQSVSSRPPFQKWFCNRGTKARGAIIQHGAFHCSFNLCWRIQVRPERTLHRSEVETSLPSTTGTSEKTEAPRRDVLLRTRNIIPQTFLFNC